MPSANHPGTLSTLFESERGLVSRKLLEAGVPSHLLEDQLQDFYVYVLEWISRGVKRKLAREDLWGRVEIYLRNVKRKSLSPGSRAWETLGSHLEEPTGEEPTVETDFEQAMIDREQVALFLSCMTEKSQAAVIVYYLVGLTREEMAEVWGVSANTAATQAFRGIRQARAFGPRVDPEEGCEMLRVNSQRVVLPMEWGSIPLEVSERSAYLIRPWYDPERVQQRWVRRPPFGSPPRTAMLWPQPTPSGGVRPKPPRPSSRLGSIPPRLKF